MVAVPFEIGVANDGCGYIKKRQDGDSAGDTDPANEGEDDGHDDMDMDDQSSRDPHVWVGISLITGFILMYLIDTLPRHAGTPSRPQRFSISLTQFSLTRDRTSSIPETPTTSSSAHQHGTTSRPSSTTVGLVIHACADGIALGASSTTTSRLSFIIFLAIMIHKAPAAFGLTSVLLKQGLSTRAARAHLIVFSLAAPVGALLTWGAAHLLGYSTAALGSSTSTEFVTGVLLLFSGGTFLYVAMHTMQESGGHAHDDMQGNGYVGVPMTDIYGSSAPSMPKRDSGGLADTLVCVTGMLIPLLTQTFGHGH
jgi:zinc transporter 9